MNPVRVIGAGLAGCEAAWQAARRGVRVELYEMKPGARTPAHKTDYMSELVCSNSLRSNETSNAVGLLKEEMRRASSLIMEAADKTRVPAGSALAVDRHEFSKYITEKIRSNELITVYEREVTEVPDDGVLTVIATGPLTTDALSRSIEETLGRAGLHFFDAAAPIVDGGTVNYDRAYFASRYGRGEPSDYLNCPMTREEYDAFYDALVTARVAELHGDDGDINVFEGCMPVEVMAARGRDTLRFGPMKPVGLPDPRTGREAYAVVQLRREDAAGSMYNLVGFQTHLAFPEQRRVFGMIPGLEDAEFLRYGVMHRNTYINSPGLLSRTYSLVSRPNIYFAGQMTGVEGYVESAASGLYAGINAARRALGEDELFFPEETMTGAMGAYVSNGGLSGNFQPMNANFGIIAPLGKKVRGGKRARGEEYARRALEAIDKMKEEGLI